MIDWLCNTFGFERHLVVKGKNNSIHHAQLTIGQGMIMLGSARDGEFDQFQAVPEKLGGTAQSAYIIVPDVDTIYESECRAGAKIAMKPHDEDYGGRGFSCFDPEGHLWNFGTYDPWNVDHSS
jgi:uncharacterized glyoxalase superfamily protein PhnB